MMFWILGAAMALVAAVIVVLPLWRRGGAQVGHTEGALAIFVDQLKEIEDERARGLISDDEAAAASVEIKRRMLTVEKQGGARMVSTGGALALMASAVLVPALAGGVYLLNGAPGLPSQPFAERADEREEDRRIAELTERLRARLLAEEDGGATEGWVLLGQTYMRMGRYGDAVWAFERLEEREDVTAGILTQLAEALIAVDQGTVTVRANALLDRALAMDPLSPAGSYYKAQWLEQDGRPAKARELLMLRMRQEQSFQPWMESFLAQINRLGESLGEAPVTLADFVDMPRGPSAEDVEAAGEMSEEDRGAFIRQMVSNLAERMKQEPENLDGWLQLGRAYSVLGERENALAAYRAAEGLLDGLAADDPRRGVVAQGLAANGG